MSNNTDFDARRTNEVYLSVHKGITMINKNDDIWTTDFLIFLIYDNNDTCPANNRADLIQSF